MPQINGLPPSQSAAVASMKKRFLSWQRLVGFGKIRDRYIFKPTRKAWQINVPTVAFCLISLVSIQHVPVITMNVSEIFVRIVSRTNGKIGFFYAILPPPFYRA